MINRIKETFRLGSIYSLSSISQKIIGFVFLPIYTSYLSPTDYGVIALVGFVFGLINPIIFTPVISGFIRHYHEPNYKERREEMFFNVILFLFFQSLVVASVFFFFSTSFSTLILDNPDLYRVIQVYAITLVLSPVSKAIGRSILLQKKAVFFSIVNISNMVFTALFTLYCLIILNLGLMSLVYTALFTAVYQFLFFIPHFIQNSKPKFELSILKPLLAYGYPLILSALGLLIIEMSDRYMLRLYAGMEDVGVYSYAYKFASVLPIILLTPMKNIINPMIFEQEEDPESLKKYINKVTIYYLIIAVFVSLCISLFAKEMAMMMDTGGNFYTGWIAIPILLLGYIFHGLRDLVSKGMAMAKKNMIGGTFYLWASVLNVGLNFVLIPLFGIIGAATSTFAAYLLIVVLAIIYSKKYYQLNFDLVKMSSILVLGMLLYFPIILIGTLPILLSFFIKIGLIIAFVVVVFNSRILDKEDRSWMTIAFLSFIKKLRSKQA